MVIGKAIKIQAKSKLSGSYSIVVDIKEQIIIWIQTH